MSTKLVIAHMDEVLIPLRFQRTEATWNRLADSFIDAVDVQASKSGDAVTISAGVLHPEVYETCWGAPPSSPIEVPHCTVQARVGQLIGRNDLWWPLGGEQTPEDAALGLTTHVLPFLDRMHGLREMERFLIETEVMKKRYPVPIISLAVLQYRRGDRIGGCRTLAELRRGALGAWKEKVGEVENRLGCEGIG